MCPGRDKFNYISFAATREEKAHGSVVLMSRVSVSRLPDWNSSIVMDHRIFYRTFINAARGNSIARELEEEKILFLAISSDSPIANLRSKFSPRNFLQSLRLRRCVVPRFKLPLQGMLDRYLPYSFVA